MSACASPGMPSRRLPKAIRALRTAGVAVCLAVLGSGLAVSSALAQQPAPPAGAESKTSPETAPGSRSGQAPEPDRPAGAGPNEPQATPESTPSESGRKKSAPEGSDDSFAPSEEVAPENDVPFPVDI